MQHAKRKVRSRSDGPGPGLNPCSSPDRTEGNSPSSMRFRNCRRPSPPQLSSTTSRKSPLLRWNISPACSGLFPIRTWRFRRCRGTLARAGRSWCICPPSHFFPRRTVLSWVLTPRVEIPWGRSSSRTRLHTSGGGISWAGTPTTTSGFRKGWPAMRRRYSWPGKRTATGNSATCCASIRKTCSPKPVKGRRLNPAGRSGSGKDSRVPTIPRDTLTSCTRKPAGSSTCCAG